MSSTQHEHWWQKRNPGYSTVCMDCGEHLQIEEQVAYVHPHKDDLLVIGRHERAEKKREAGQ